MLPHELQNLLPQSPPAAEILEPQRLTRDFYHELQYRQELERHCQWYYKTVQQHQQEFKKMQRDINILGWFRRGQL